MIKLKLHKFQKINLNITSSELISVYFFCHMSHTTTTLNAEIPHIRSANKVTGKNDSNFTEGSNHLLLKF